MDDLIKRAENYLTWDDNDPEVLNILQELIERVRELEAALEQIANQAVEPAYCYEIADRWHKIARKALGRG